MAIAEVWLGAQDVDWRGQAHRQRCLRRPRRSGLRGHSRRHGVLIIYQTATALASNSITCLLFCSFESVTSWSKQKLEFCTQVRLNLWPGFTAPSWPVATSRSACAPAWRTTQGRGRPTTALSFWAGSTTCIGIGSALHAL